VFLHVQLAPRKKVKRADMGGEMKMYYNKEVCFATFRTYVSSPVVLETKAIFSWLHTLTDRFSKQFVA
jgi:hypothetical protein